MRVVIIAAALVLAVRCSDKAAEEETKSAVQSDESSVTMPAETARLNGITVVALQPIGSSASMPIGNAAVVDVTELVNVASQVSAATAQRDQAAAHLQATRAELARLRTLSADDHNVSDRAVQEAAAAAASDEAAVRSADAASQAAETAARQRWGGVLVRGVLGGAAWGRQLASRELVLVEAAFTDATTPPARIVLTGAGGRPVTATYLAPSPHVDPRLQKTAYDYLAAGAELPVGLVTTIHGNGSTATGVVVPRAAVVWFGEQSLVFLEDRAGHYVQHPVDTSRPAQGGFLDASLQPGQRVVTEGAQQLLSEQHKPEVE